MSFPLRIQTNALIPRALREVCCIELESPLQTELNVLQGFDKHKTRPTYLLSKSQHGPHASSETTGPIPAEFRIFSFYNRNVVHTAHHRRGPGKGEMERPAKPCSVYTSRVTGGSRELGPKQAVDRSTLCLCT